MRGIVPACGSFIFKGNFNMRKHIKKVLATIVLITACTVMNIEAAKADYPDWVTVTA